MWRGAVPVDVREIGTRGGIVMMGGKGTALTTETKKDRGAGTIFIQLRLLLVPPFFVSSVTREKAGT